MTTTQDQDDYNNFFFEPLEKDETLKEIDARGFPLGMKVQSLPQGSRDWYTARAEFFAVVEERWLYLEELRVKATVEAFRKELPKVSCLRKE